jgi:hypothetical protein
MRYFRGVVFCLILLCPVLVRCADAQVLGESRDQEKVLLTLEKPIVKSGRHFSAKWTIANGSSKTIWIYSTFLKGPGAGITEDASGVVILRTSIASIETVGVNTYPRADFLKLAPGMTISGTLADELPTELRQTLPRRLRMEVAFGLTIDGVRERIAEAYRNGEHPANPIIRWRTELFGEASFSNN